MAAARRHRTRGFPVAHTGSQQPSAWWNPHPLCRSALASPLPSPPTLSSQPLLLPPARLCVHVCVLCFPHRVSVSFFPFRFIFISPSSSPTPSRLCGTPLGWLLLAAPVPPTLSLDMLFIGLQRGWLTVQGGSCLKQCSLNKGVRSS